jgi:hypothetical protein
MPYFGENDDTMEPCGVKMLDSLDTDATEEMQKKGLKYSKPLTFLTLKSVST